MEHRFTYFWYCSQVTGTESLATIVQPIMSASERVHLACSSARKADELVVVTNHRPAGSVDNWKENDIGLS